MASCLPDRTRLRNLYLQPLLLALESERSAWRPATIHLHLCERGDSNPHEDSSPDPKSDASTSSATLAALERADPCRTGPSYRLRAGAPDLSACRPARPARPTPSDPPEGLARDGPDERLLLAPERGLALAQKRVGALAPVGRRGGEPEGVRLDEEPVRQGPVESALRRVEGQVHRGGAARRDLLRDLLAERQELVGLRDPVEQTDPVGLVGSDRVPRQRASRARGRDRRCAGVSACRPSRG